MLTMSFIQQVVIKIKTWYAQFLDWAWPYWLKLKPWVDKLILYFKTHRWARITVYIGGPPFAIFVLLLFVVWFETPWNSELRRIRNQVASEIYSADSVLIGRYYIQDRTEVAFKDIAPAVREALVATEDAR